MLTADGKGYLGVEINTSKGRCSFLQDFDKLMPSDLIRHQEVCTESPTQDARPQSCFTVYGFHGKRESNVTNSGKKQFFTFLNARSDFEQQ